MSRLMLVMVSAVFGVSGAVQNIPSALASNQAGCYNLARLHTENGVTDPIQDVWSDLASDDQNTPAVDPAVDATVDEVLPVEAEEVAVDENATVDPSDDSGNQSEQTISFGEDTGAAADDKAAPVADPVAGEQPADQPAEQTGEQPADLTYEQLGDAFAAVVVDPIMQLIDDISDVVNALVQPETPAMGEDVAVTTLDNSTDASLEPTSSTDDEAAATNDELATPTSLGDVHDLETPWFDSADLGTEFEGTLRPDMLDTYWANLPLNTDGRPELTNDDALQIYDQIQLCLYLLSRDDLTDEQIQQLDATIIAQTALLDFAVMGDDAHEDLFAMLTDGPLTEDQLTDLAGLVSVEFSLADFDLKADQFAMLA